MKMKEKYGMKVLLLGLWFCSLTVFAYALEPGMPSSNTGEDRLVPGVSATASKSSEDRILPPNSTSSSPDSSLFLQSGSKAVYETPLVNAPTPEHDGKEIPNDGSAQKQPILTPKQQPSEQEVGEVVDVLSSKMVAAGLGTDVSQTFSFINNEDYAGLVKFQEDNPRIMQAIIKSLEEISKMYSANTPSKGFADDWLEKFKQVQENLLKSKTDIGSLPDPTLIEAVARLYKPFAARLRQIENDFKEGSRVSGEGVKEPSSGDLLKNFGGKAREFVLDSLNRAQTNLADGMLSNPLEAVAFAAETAPIVAVAIAPEEMIARKMTLTEEYVNARKKRYQVIDSAFIGKDFIYAQKMLHPPANLHPYLKWLLYTRNLTPRMVEHYLATREAVGAIYEQAKAGQGNIRYRDKVYGAFLPFAVTAAGNYELVKPASGE